MKLPLYLALKNLLHHPGRNLLYILGISITAALLLDMILLASGLSVSLERVLRQMGYEVRLSPRGTLPFETDAQISNFTKLKSQLLRFPSVDHVDAMLGSTIAVESRGQTFTAFALGLQQQKPVLYQITSGADWRAGTNEVVVNQYLAQKKQIRPGDRFKIWNPNESQSTGTHESLEVRVSGIGYFHLDAEGQFTISCPLPFLQELKEEQKEDPVSVVMIKLVDPSLAEKISNQINTTLPRVSAYTITTVLQAVDKQLSYFKQFAYILGGISLVVTFVLIFIITTISFHDRVGEIALLRAIGLSHKTIFSTILFEGILTSLASAAFGFLLGKIVALYLDAILTSAPGLPENFSFFVMQPGSILKALLTVLLTGLFAGLYPASAAVSLPVADTLREEIL